MRALVVCVGLALLLAPAATAAKKAPAVEYRVDLSTDIKEKPYKFYVASQPTAATCAMVYAVAPGAGGLDVSLKSAHFTWTTSGVVIRKDVLPDGVTLVDNDVATTQWKPGQKRKGEPNPLELFGKPFARLSSDGRGDSRLLKNPEGWMRFMKNFSFGRAPLLHRPRLPGGELKAGQTWSTEVHVPDGIYAGVEWPVKVDWTVRDVSGGVATVSGAGAATRDEVESQMGLLTDGTASIASTVKVDAKTGALVSGESTIDARWKKDPSGSPTGIMDYVAHCVVREKKASK